MADNELINTSVDEYLISLANSINHAQRYISQLRIAGQDGQPSVTYQLPRVEFELKLQFQLDRRHPPSGHSQRNVAKGEGGGFLEARPLSLEAGEMDSSTAAAASTIKGSFVAVPVHGGTPPPVVTIAWKRAADGARRIAITVSVRSAIGEPLIGREVQFNLDKDLARRLNALWSSVPDAQVLKNTTLQYGVQPTKGNGKAENTLTIGDALPELKVPVVIDVLGITKTMIFTPA
ncbi:MAG: hypothetical protein ACT4QB_21935 [Gammaproteobacteria bacterium]